MIDPFLLKSLKKNCDTPDKKSCVLASIQTKSGDPLMHNQLTLEWMKVCKTQNTRMLMVIYNEDRPELNLKARWIAYMAGAVWEVHVLGFYDRPMNTCDDTWSQPSDARTFMKSLPIWEKLPHNELIRSGKAYAIYISTITNISIKLAENKKYPSCWCDPENGIE